MVVSIGLSILKVGVSSFGSSSAYPLGSWQNLLVATITLAAALIFHTTLKGVAKQLYVLLGMVVGYAVSIFFGMVDFAAMGDTIRELGVIAVPQLFAFKPQFQPAAIYSFCLVFIVSAVETIGDTTACCKGGLSRDITADEISGSLCVDGFFNELPSFIGDIFAGNMVAGVFVVGLILDLCLPRDPSHYEGM